MTATDRSRPLLIGNCSGFYGDRLSALRELLEGSPRLDVITGDYLAELTMLILAKDTFKDPEAGYARTFLRQIEDCLALAVEKGVRIVTNAGGLNPAGLAERIRAVATEQGIEANVAHVAGDDLRESGLFPGALTANAYLGAQGIAAALRDGADIVVTGRVTDASLVVGPAMWWHGWNAGDYDALAGAVVVGHVLECGTQACGGNFSGFTTLDPAALAKPLGFPIAEVARDGSSVITKQADTGGAVTLDTVSAQLLYEIQGTEYLGPDVTTHLDSIRLSDDGADRVRISGVRGSEPPETLKVCVNDLGGWRNSVEFVLTGLDVDAKEEWLKNQIEAAWAATTRPASVAWSRGPAPAQDPATIEEAATVLRCTVLDPDAKVAGKGLTAPAVELALASYPGLTLTAPPSPATPYGVYRPEYVDRDKVQHRVVHADDREEIVT